MSKSKCRPRKLQLEGLPLRNITASLNLNQPAVCAKSKMSYSDDSGFSNLTSSPMSSLAFNLSELSTGRTTPRRRLSMSNIDTPPHDGDKTNAEGIFSAESGCFSGSPLDDSPTLDRLNTKNRYTTLLHPDIPLEAFSAKKKTIAFRRISSEPLPTLRLDSPTDFLDEEDSSEATSTNKDDVEKKSDDDRFSLDDAFSQDSGLGMEKRSISMSSFDDDDVVGPSFLSRLPSLEDVWNSMESTDFKAPKGKPPKRTRSVTEDRLFSEDTCSPIKYSPVKSSLPRPSFSLSLFTEGSPSPKKVNTDKEKVKSSVDDGFQELFAVEDLQNEADDQVSSLMNAPLLHDLRRDKGDESGLSFLSRQTNHGCKRVKFCKDDEKDSTPTSRSSMPRRIFQRSQSLDIRPRLSTKRCEPPEDICDLMSSCKRLKAEDDSEVVAFSPADSNSCPVSSNIKSENFTSGIMVPCIRRLHRCHSETEATIKSAVSRMAMEPNLIGDCSKPYCLPIIQGKHQDLKSISPETLCRVLGHEYDDEIEEYHIIDCRYPYEYKGGHIKNALNIYTKDEVLEKYLKCPLTAKDPNKRVILIFHCEFSSERGPGLSRFLRRHDRESNKECYPFLHYPELYLLDGGYKNFFESYDYLCEPRQYRTMLDKDHGEDLRKFRAKSKSWAGEKSNGRPGYRNLKF